MCPAWFTRFKYFVELISEPEDRETKVATNDNSYQMLVDHSYSASATPPQNIEQELDISQDDSSSLAQRPAMISKGKSHID